MTTPENSNPPQELVSELERLQLSIYHHTDQVTLHEAARNSAFVQAHNLIDAATQNGATVPDEAKFIVAALGTDRKHTEEMIKKLRDLDEQVTSAAGQLAAWITAEKRVDITNFVTPEQSYTGYRLHIGYLPIDANLKVRGWGQYSVPIERSVSTPINPVYQFLDYPSFENEIVPLFYGDDYRAKTPILEDKPGIDVSLWDSEKPYPLVIGNDAVAEVLDKNKLDENWNVTKALEVLTSTLF